MLQQLDTPQGRAPLALPPPHTASASDARAPLGRLGTLEVHLARDADDVRRAQHLRYQVFHGEMAAEASAATHWRQRDADAFDAICDHLLVVDCGGGAHAAHGARVVGTYRLLRQEIAERHGGFYSAAEFDVAPLIARHPHLRFLELGRSCVAAPYRNRRTVELLWHGIWHYVRMHRVDAMFGCASFPGTCLETLAPALAYLHHFAAAQAPWQVRAQPGRHAAMGRLAADAIDAPAVWRGLPALIKGYLRLGARVGGGAVIDRRFRTTDVLMTLPVAAIDRRYIAYFGATGERHAA
jgi:putative hemolysin